MLELWFGLVNDKGRYHFRRTDRRLPSPLPVIASCGGGRSHLRVAAPSRNREGGSGQNGAGRLDTPVDLGETNDQRRLSQRFHWLLEGRMQYLKQRHLECVRLEVYLRCKR